MKVKLKTRFGKEVEFERKEKVFIQRPNERFTTALVRTWYPALYKKHQQMQKGKTE